MDSGDLMVWIRGPDGTFQPKKPAVRNWTSTETVVGDGRADIPARDADGTLKLRTGRGDAVFDDPRTAPVRWWRGPEGAQGYGRRPPPPVPPQDAARM
ncbi:hypothetical protein [Streptomyces bikiniensis]|uniref:hypothetical protein n=1 Tax=Streptomyces bikiniensis TaxID=1896 RepID=UPI0004C165AC|nr:hypothetical protein [Streptomyces bikiniensis]